MLGHRRPSAAAKSDDEPTASRAGAWRSRTSRVITAAKIPSLRAARRPVGPRRGGVLACVFSTYLSIAALVLLQLDSALSPRWGLLRRL
jgi:hypothetical protein